MADSAYKPTLDEIARLADMIWESEGRPEGRDHEHWLKAKNLLAEGGPGTAFPGALLNHRVAEASAHAPHPEPAGGHV